MPVRKYKPTSPGRRFMSVSTFEEITKTTPEKSADSSRSRRRAAATPTAASRRATRAAATSAATASSTSSAEGRRAGQGRRDRVRPEPLGADRAAPLRGRREGVHPRAGAARRRRDGRVGPGADIKPGNALPLANIPTGTLVHNVELKPGQGGQMARSAGSGSSSSRRTTATPSSASRRARCGACRSPAAPPSARSGTSTTRTSRRQGGPQPLARQAPDRARLGDEPGRPPARRRRGQVEGRPPSGHAVGRADARQAHAPQAQGIRQADRPRPAPRKGEALDESQSQEGALRRGAADEPHRGDERRRARSG